MGYFVIATQMDQHNFFWKVGHIEQEITKLKNLVK